MVVTVAAASAGAEIRAAPAAGTGTVVFVAAVVLLQVMLRWLKQ